MHASAPPIDAERTVSAPLGSSGEGRLELVPGAARLTLRAGADGELVRARFHGREPAMEAREGTLVVRYPRLGALRPRRDTAEIALTPDVAWEIRVRGGTRQTDADLRALELTAIEIGGGASEVELSLPRPRGTVPVRVQDGASRITVRRPREVPVRLRISGGVSSLSFDAQELCSAGGTVQLETAGWHDTSDRYELEIEGGASRLTLTAFDESAPQGG